MDVIDIGRNRLMVTSVERNLYITQRLVIRLKSLLLLVILPVFTNNCAVHVINIQLYSSNHAIIYVNLDIKQNWRCRKQMAHLIWMYLESVMIIHPLIIHEFLNIRSMREVPKIYMKTLSIWLMHNSSYSSALNIT